MRSIDVLASFASMEKSGLLAAVSATGGDQLQALMKAYGRLRNKSEKLKKAADADFLAAKKDKRPRRSLMRYLDGAIKRVGAHAEYLEAESVMTRSLQGQHMKEYAELVTEQIVGLPRQDKLLLKDLLNAVTQDDYMHILWRIPEDVASKIEKAAGTDAAKYRRLLLQWGSQEAERLMAKGRKHAGRTKTTEYGMDFNNARTALTQQLKKYDVSVTKLEKYLETIGKDLKEFADVGMKGLAKELGVDITDLADVEKLTETKGTSRALVQKYVQLYEAQQALIQSYTQVRKQVDVAKKAAEDIAKMSPAQLERAQIEAVQDYVAELRKYSASVQQVAKINPRVFEQAQELIRGRDRAKFKEEMNVGSVFDTTTLEEVPIVGAATREGATMARRLDLEGLEGKALREALQDVTDDLFLTDTLVKIFNDPYGAAQFSRNRVLAKDGILGLFTNFKAWLIYGSISFKRAYRRYPIFTTNLRLLESPVSQELDDLHKEMARMASNFRDGFNLVADNLPREANSIIFDILTNRGQVTELASKYKLPLTPGQKITLDMTAGLNESPVRLFFKNGVSMGRALKLDTPVEMADMPGLDAFISLLVKEPVVKGEDFVSNLRLPLREMTLRSFLKMHKDGSAEAMSDGELFVAMVKTVQRHIEHKDIRRVAEKVGFKDADGKPAIAYRSSGQLYNSVVLGALLEMQAARANGIMGARFRPEQAEYINRMYGDPGKAGYGPKTIEVGSYVVLSEDIAAAKRLASSLFNEAGDLGDNLASTVRTTKIGGKRGGKVSPLGMYTPKEIRTRIDKLPKTVTLDSSTMPRVVYEEALQRGIDPETAYPSVRDTIEWMANNARSDVYQRLAQYLLPFTKSDSPFIMAGKDVLGDAEGMASFTRRQPGGVVYALADELTESTIIHEVIHHTMSPRIAKLLGGEQGEAFIKLFDNLRTRSRPFFSDDDFTIMNSRGKELLKAVGAPEGSEFDYWVGYALKNPDELPAVMFTEPYVRRFFEVLRTGAPEPGKGVGFADVITDILDVPKEIRSAFRDVARRSSRLLSEEVGATPQIQRTGRARPTKDVPADPGAKKGPTRGYVPGKPKRQKAGWRSPILEKLSGAPAYRVNKIEKTKRGATAYYLNSSDGTGRPLILTRHEIELRPDEFSIMDLVDGASILGLESLTQAGRKSASAELEGLRIGFQKLVIMGVDEFGQVRAAPRTMVTNLIQGFARIERELAESISPEVAQFGLMRTGIDGLSEAMKIWKTHILTGLAVPRPAYFSNEIMGNFAQMVDSVGFFEAGQLSLIGSMAYVPVFGKALQDSYLKLAAKHGGTSNLLPFAFSAMFNTSLQKILTGSDELMGKLPDGTRPTYGQFMGQASRAGINESIITPDMSKVLRDVLMAQMRENPTLYQKLKANGQGLGYMQRMMQIKIREVTRRQRLLFYSHLRINKGMTHDAAKVELHNTLYDWTYSVGKIEMQSIGRFVLFYTLIKNAMAQVTRSFFELSNVGAAEYAKRYARGGTKLQRMELMSRLMTAEVFDKPGPFQEMTPEEKSRRAAMMKLPDYLAEYPILKLGALPPEALEIMGEGGFVRSHYARVLPKLTTVEFMLNYLDIVGAFSAIAAGVVGKAVDVTGIDPDGTLFPYSTSISKAAVSGSETMIDQFLTPIYGDYVETLSRELLGIGGAPQSQLGRRAKPGDMAMMQLLSQFGLADSSAVIDDPNLPGTKRIIGVWGSPWASTFILNMPKTEIHRLRMMLSVAFPGMAPAEIRALAKTDKSAGVRLEAVASLLNVGKAVFYNGNNESYYELDEVRDAYSRLEKRLEAINETPVGGKK